MSATRFCLREYVIEARRTVRAVGRAGEPLVAQFVVPGTADLAAATLLKACRNQLGRSGEIGLQECSANVRAHGTRSARYR